MRLPQLKLCRAPEFQMERLKRWLMEWEIDRELRIIDHDYELFDPPARGKRAEVGGIKDEPDPESGQIRLLSPALLPVSSRMIYVALLKDAENDSFLAIPYGRFAEPCLPGELQTTRDVPCLRVLCLWNSMTLPRALVEASWVVDTLQDEETLEALKVLEHIETGTDLDPALTTRIGPSQWHPADPRLEYATKEKLLMNNLIDDHTSRSGIIEYPPRDQAWPKAAEERDPYGEK